MIDLLRIHVRALWAWEGRIGRLSYCCLNLLAFGIAFAIVGADLKAMDASSLLGSYVVLGPMGLLTSTQGSALAVGVGFILAWVHYVVAVKRVRHLGWTPEVALLTFVPTGNLVLASLLALVPSWTHSRPTGAAASLLRGPIRALFPQSDLGSGVLAVLATLGMGLAVSKVSASETIESRWGLFLVVPFFTGILLPLIFGFHRVRTFRACLGLAMASVLLQIVVFADSSPEGGIWLIYALPILLVPTVLGLGLGYAIQLRPEPRPTRRVSLPRATNEREVWMQWEI